MIGPIIAIIGALLLLIGGIIAIMGIFELEALLASYGETWASIGADPTFLYLNFILTLVFGIIAMVGAIVAFKSVKVGGAICLIIGLVATIGNFIPIGSITITPYVLPITLNSTFIIADPIIVLIGGILCFVLKD